MSAAVDARRCSSRTGSSTVGARARSRSLAARSTLSGAPRVAGAGRGAGPPRSSPGSPCVLVALQSGIDAYDDRLLSVHMVQHLLLLLLAPLLLLGGRPVDRSRCARCRPARGAALAPALARARAGSPRPGAGLAVFAASSCSRTCRRSTTRRCGTPALHDAEHALYLLAGLLFWWPLLDGDPAAGRRLGGLGRLVYLLAAMPPMALVGAYLNRAPTLVYPAYGAPARALGISALVDQQQAGAIMWVVGDASWSRSGCGRRGRDGAPRSAGRRRARARAGASVAAGAEGAPT